MGREFLGVVTLLATALLPISSAPNRIISPLSSAAVFTGPDEERILRESFLDLTNRHPTPVVNEIFKDNILLALHYLKGDVNNSNVDWERIHEPFGVSFILSPGEIFAFHNQVLPEFKNPSVMMNSKFYVNEGYKSAGGLGGNGVCHLASLMNWVAQGTGLEVTAKVKHNFAPVPGVPQEYGTSIRSQSPTQNLYIRNNFGYPVEFSFEADSKQVRIKILSLDRDSNP